MATENIVTGKKYRILKDATNKIWDVISFWTKASDVYNNNNQNLQTTVGGITGISSSLTSTSSSIAASANAVKQLNDKITQLNSDISGRTIKYSGSIRAVRHTNGSATAEVNLTFTDDSGKIIGSINAKDNVDDADENSNWPYGNSTGISGSFKC